MPTDEPALAAATGRIVYAAPISGYGEPVRIDHGNGYVTWYSHLVDADANLVGSWANRRYVIGTSGSSGTAASHRYFDLRHNDRFTGSYGWSVSGADTLATAYLNCPYGEPSPYLWFGRDDSVVVVEDRLSARFTGTDPTTDWGRGNGWSMLHTANNPAMTNYSRT